MSTSAEKLEQKHPFQCDVKKLDLVRVRSSFGDFHAHISYVDSVDTIEKCFEVHTVESEVGHVVQPAAGLLMVSNYFGDKGAGVNSG